MTIYWLSSYIKDREFSKKWVASRTKFYKLADQTDLINEIDDDLSRPLMTLRSTENCIEFSTVSAEGG